MSDWQERITHETAPAIRAEHELRYRLAAPLIKAAGVWADLGCGNGLAALAALGATRPPKIILVDVDEQAVAIAARTLEPPPVRCLAADLSDARDLQRIADELLAKGGEPVVTCFEVVEHLGSFVPLLEWSKRLASDHAATILLSVPNDAFWSIRNPHHLTRWGEGAFEELSQLLPEQHTLVRQVSLAGSAIVDWGAARERHELAVETGGEDTIATHFLAVFGPRHAEIRHSALAVQTAMVEQRRWERERESNLAIAQRRVEEQDALIAQHNEQLREQTAEFDAWRIYIHELERELGKPLSGEPVQDAETLPSAEQQAANEVEPTP